MFNSSDLTLQDVPTDIKKCKNAQNQKFGSNLTESYMAGICLNDIISNRIWKHKVFNKPKNG